MKKTGRKSLLTQDVVEMARDYFKYGRLTGYTSLALAIHCHPNTIQKWVREGFNLMGSKKSDRTEDDQLKIDLAEIAKIPDELLEAAHTAIHQNLTGDPQYIDLATARYVIDRADQQNLAILTSMDTSDFREEDDDELE